MSWHHMPKDDAWKQAHLAMLVKLGKRAWLHRNDCRHSVTIEPAELAQRHQLDMQTPLLTISKQCAAHAVGRRGDAAGRSRAICGRARSRGYEGQPAAGKAGPHQQTRTVRTSLLVA
jgi:hypothetical protein